MKDASLGLPQDNQMTFLIFVVIFACWKPIELEQSSLQFVHNFSMI